MVNDTGRMSKICAKILSNNKFPDDSSQAKSENVHKFKVQRIRIPRFWVHNLCAHRFEDPKPFCDPWLYRKIPLDGPLGGFSD